MNIDEQITAVEGAVTKFLFENRQLLPLNILGDTDSMDHVKSIAVSILCTKWNVGYPGGSFVQSLVKNDLYGSFANADSINRQCIYFYVVMMSNVGMPRELWVTDKITNI